MRNPEEYIRKIIEAGESQVLDFKYEIEDSKKIAKTLVAFANTDGGTLLLGVKDNGTISGIRTEEEYYMLENASFLYCQPEVKFNVNKWVIDGKMILEVYVPPQDDKPYKAKNNTGKWLAYLRVKDSNLLANRIMLKVWERKKSGNASFIRYTEIEKLLFDYFKSNEFITLSKFGKLAGLKYYKAENILINLICLNILEIVFTEKQVYYKINEKTLNNPI